MPNFHIRSCLAFGHCNDTAENGATFVRFEWALNLKNPSWPEMLPAVDQTLKCMTNKETIHIEQSWPRNEVCAAAQQPSPQRSMPLSSQHTSLAKAASEACARKAPEDMHASWKLFCADDRRGCDQMCMRMRGRRWLCSRRLPSGSAPTTASSQTLAQGKRLLPVNLPHLLPRQLCTGCRGTLQP